MSLLSRIAKGAAAAAPNSLEPGYAGAGRMLKVGDLVHSVPAPQSTAGEAESASGDSVASAGAESIVASSPAARSTFAATSLAPVQTQSTEPHTVALDPVRSAATFAEPVNAVAAIGHAEHTLQVHVPGRVGAPVTTTRQTALPLEPAFASVRPTAIALDLTVPRVTAGAVEPVAAVSHDVIAARPLQSGPPVQQPAAQRTTQAATRRAEALPVQQAAASIDQAAVSIAQSVSAGSQPQPAMVAPAAALSQRAVTAVSAGHLSSQRSAAPAAPRSAPPQPRVHIGSLEVIVAAPPAPAPQQAAPLRGASFASRHNLRGL